MPANDSEPENYSIDDMMDRLRTRGGEGSREGEAKLVTRDDGTQVYKMRKRKRRSHQPKKEKEKSDKRMRVAQVVTAVALVAGSGLALVGSLIYLNTPGYHDKISERVKVWTGAEPKISQLRVTPLTAGASAVELRWPETSLIQSLTVRGVQGELAVPSLIGGLWKGTEMLGGQGGTLVLRQPVGPAPAMPARSGEIPFQFRYRAPQFTVLVGDEAKPAARLSGTEATLEVLDTAATTANLRFDGGSIYAPGWGDFALNFASLQFSPEGMRVGIIRMTPSGKTGGGNIEITNPDKSLLDLRGKKSDLTIRVGRLQLGSLLGPNFGPWLSAEVETPENGEAGIFSYDADSPTLVSFRIPFRATASSDSVWKQLPMFGVLAKEVGETWYQAPIFDLEANGVLVRSGAVAGLERLHFASRNRLVLDGSLTADAQGVLEGSLEVGLPDGLVNNASAAMRAVFKRRDGGYSWATVRLSGTGRQPQDDLQKQLDTASTTATPAAGGNQSLEDAFREIIESGEER
ncbi:hypothetical protein OKA04_21770 [Luteolibacter flavescens]|uniref:AsmA-like C-terminal domain-containing protein n=1 Tax=Luteolibacter flavescens TaxID=1859460 RepID=A0ABT3FUW3_9BACT|nr:hypothetical protein [Luteolibacter flavescens]MCW1887381.1 hypothetical protein [Luteolibacter flavescens]